jgi:hypothetical protein
LYQNKQAGISSFALTLHSSFSTFIPEILGKNGMGAEYNNLLFPCTKTYNEWFFNDDGVMTRAKPRIMSGIAYHRSVHGEILNNLALTHPVGAGLGWNLLQRSCNVNEVKITTMYNIWTEYQAHYSEVMPVEAFSLLCTILGQIHREFRKVRQHGSAAIQQGSDTHWICAIWWYALQTHSKIDELLDIGLKQHPAIMPVFTAHLDRHIVSKTTFGSRHTLS